MQSYVINPFIHPNHVVLAIFDCFAIPLWKSSLLQQIAHQMQDVLEYILASISHRTSNLYFSFMSRTYGFSLSVCSLQINFASKALLTSTSFLIPKPPFFLGWQMSFQVIGCILVILPSSPQIYLLQR